MHAAREETSALWNRDAAPEQLKLIAALISSADNSKINWKNQSCSQLLNDDGMVGRCVFFLLENACSFRSLQGHSPQPPRSHPWSPGLTTPHIARSFDPQTGLVELAVIEQLRAPLWTKSGE